MAGLSDTAELLVLDWITVTGSPTRPAGFYLALYTTNPPGGFETDTSAVEATGGGYVRKSLTMTAAAAGSASNTTATAWTVGTDLAAGTYKGWGLYSASVAGTYLGGAVFSADRIVSVSGDKINFAIGSVVLTAD